MPIEKDQRLTPAYHNSTMWVNIECSRMDTRTGTRVLEWRVECSSTLGTRIGTGMGNRLGSRMDDSMDARMGYLACTHEVAQHTYRLSTSSRRLCTVGERCDWMDSCSLGVPTHTTPFTFNLLSSESSS